MQISCFLGETVHKLLIPAMVSITEKCHPLGVQVSELREKQFATHPKKISLQILKNLL